MIRSVTRPVGAAAAPIAVLCALALPSIVCSAPQIRLDRIKLPPGFAISVYADHVPEARSMTLAPDGTLFVGNREKDKVYAVVDKRVVTIASGLRMPNGVAFRDGSLYVAETSRVLRYDGVLDWVKQASRATRWSEPDGLLPQENFDTRILVFGDASGEVGAAVSVPSGRA